MLILKNGYVVDPENGIDGKKDIAIKDGKIFEIKDEICAENADIIELDGKHIFPGFIDMHVHLREPGREDKETIETGLKAAAAGGFTGLAPMPNTNPVCDNKVIVEYIMNKSKKLGYSKIYPIGAISKGQKGEELAAIGDMVDSGAVAISDDGRPVTDSLLTRRALDYIKKFDIPLISHSEDVFLSRDGVVHEGEYSLKLGLKGIPSSAEEIMVARDIILCENSKSKLHIAHASTKGTMNLIRERNFLSFIIESQIIVDTIELVTPIITIT